MRYNLKNARNGKSASKLAKWPSLRPLAFKSKFMRQFEFLEDLEDSYGNDFFHTNPSYSLENPDSRKFTCLNGEGHFSIRSFHFWHSSGYNP